MRKFNSTIIAFATLAALGSMSQQAVAGESYVRNSDTRSFSKTTTDLTLNSRDWSDGYREWSNYADKIYIDGSESFTHDYTYDYTYDYYNRSGGYSRTTAFDYDKYTVHTAGAVEFGAESFGSESKVNGTIFTYSTEDTTAHESAAGNR